MEFLISRGLPQRTAHHAVGKLVNQAMEQKKRLSDLTLEEIQQVDSSLDRSVYDVLGVSNAIKAFQSYGSTAPAQVDHQIARWKARLQLS